ncbi:hypothetical protein [Methylobacillus flagellatus]|uniref:hypothetical protein n=1 Tax=Methylobacillus flagellatus TaxID=405 RepID=UPI0010F4A3C5|nr:hypothetical protein [Methylobacillus flagellatus]
MANADTTLRTDIITRLDALGALDQAYAIAAFLQGVLTLKSNDGIVMDPNEVTGLYYIMEDMKDRIKQSSHILTKATNSLSLDKQVES